MTATLRELGIAQLSAEDRLASAEAIWRSVPEEVEAEPISEAQRRELEGRLADSISRPDAVIPCEAVKARALAMAEK